MPQCILIVGGVAAGLSAASRARRLSRDAVITVLERGPVAAYGACGLPYFLSGRVAELERLIVHQPDFFRDRRRIEVLTGHEVLELQTVRRRVRVRSGAKEFELAFDGLVLATGAVAAWQPAPAGLRNVFGANTWTEVQLLDEALRREPYRRAAVVGAGYIGLEVAEALAQRGFRVGLFDRGSGLVHGFDADLSQLLQPALTAAGIDLHLGVDVLGLEGIPGGRVTGVLTTAGRWEADLVVNCAGLRPNTGLAAAAGVELGRTGGIAVDDGQRTNQAAIWAAGDCAETRHLVTGAAVWIPLGAAANRQGRVAGQNAIGGRPARFAGVLGTLALPVFGRELGRTGLSLEQARAAGFDAAVEQVESAAEAPYLGGRRLILRIVFQPSTQRLLGCHLLGDPGTVAQRLNVAAVAIASGMRLEQIEALDLAYSPALAPLYEPLSVAAHNARRH